VKERRINLLRQGPVIPCEDLVSCRPSGGEREPALEPGEVVVFFEQFQRGFALPASNFLWQFLDHFHLQPHHIGANAMMTLSTFGTLCEAYLGILPSVELFRRLLYFKTQTTDSILVTYGAASFYARKTAGFPKLTGKESCKKWQRSFFYVKNLRKDVDHVNLPPFDAGGPGERDNWSASLPGLDPDMANILQRIITLQAEGSLKPSDLLLAFIDADVSPLQRRSHKMCFLGSNRDPTRHSSKVLSAAVVAQKANKIAKVRLLAKWAWGLKPHDRNNQIVEVRFPGSIFHFPNLRMLVG
jgi:hypothetical protein